MKQYIAQKAMKFDKSYSKGTEIPKNVIAKDMLNKLLRCGALAEIEVAETKVVETEVVETEDQNKSLEETEQTKTVQNKKSKKVDGI